MEQGGSETGGGGWGVGEERWTRVKINTMCVEDGYNRQRIRSNVTLHRL